MFNVSNRCSSVLCFTKRKKGTDLVDYMKNKYGEETSWRKFVRSVPRNFKCFSAGIYEDEIGMMQCYAHIYIYFQIGIYWDLAMLLQSFLFQNAISHMVYSNFPSHVNLITSPLQWRNLSGSLLRIFYFIATRLWPTSAYTGWHLTILLVNFVIVPQFMVVRPATVTSYRFLCTLQRLDRDHSSLEAQKFGTHWTLIWKNINR